MSVAWVGAGIAALGAASSISSARSASRAQSRSADASIDEQRRQYDQTRDDLAPYRQAGNQSLSELQYLLGLGDPASRIGGPPDESEANFNSSAYLAANPDVADPSKWAKSAYDHWLEYGRGEGRAFTPLQAPQEQATATHTGSYGDLNRDFTLADFQKDPGYQFRMDEGQKGLERSAAARGGLLNGGTLRALSRYGQDYASGEYSNAYNRFNNDRTTRFNRLSSLAGTGQTATLQ